MMRLPPLAEKEIERLPVGAQEGFEGGAGNWRISVASGQHHAPVRRSKDCVRLASVHEASVAGPDGNSSRQVQRLSRCGMAKSTNRSLDSTPPAKPF